jgi:hypothetical protein
MSGCRMTQSAAARWLLCAGQHAMAALLQIADPKSIVNMTRHFAPCKDIKVNNKKAQGPATLTMALSASQHTSHGVNSTSHGLVNQVVPSPPSSCRLLKQTELQLQQDLYAPQALNKEDNNVPGRTQSLPHCILTAWARACASQFHAAAHDRPR